MNFERVGTGQPMLMVHGLGANLRTWNPLLSALSGSRELVLVDLPGHGRSTPLAGPQTFDAYADALAHFVDSQGLATADLIGSSIGGRLVLELARRGIGRHCVVPPTRPPRWHRALWTAHCRQAGPKDHPVLYWRQKCFAVLFLT